MSASSLIVQRDSARLIYKTYIYIYILVSQNKKSSFTKANYICIQLVEGDYIISYHCWWYKPQDLRQIKPTLYEKEN